MKVRAALRKLFSRKTIGKDAASGLVLGIEAVPDGLAAGLLAGLNPLAGLYGYLFGMVGATFFTSSTFMAVQATGAMALIVADSDLQSLPDPDRALFTLAIMTGIVMIFAGLLGGGRLVRFVPTAVMTGFITAVGMNIVLGQLSNFTGYAAEGANRLTKLFDVLVHFPQWSISSVTVGLLVIAMIYLFRLTPFGSLGLVVAVVLGSALAVLLNQWLPDPVLLLNDIVDVPSGLPAPVLPQLNDVVFLLLPAFSLAFVGLVQGAAVSSGLPTPDGKPADTSRDFIGQGAGNIASGLFQGMPVGGSMSGSSLMVAAGAKTRLSFIVAGAVMTLVIFFAADLVSYVAMPALAGLLIVDRDQRDQAEPHLLGDQERAAADDDHGGDLRADARRAAAVRRARGCRHGHHPVRRAAVQPRARPASARARGRPHPRERSAAFDRRGGGGHPPALRQPVLRQRADLRAPAARRSAAPRRAPS